MSEVDMETEANYFAMCLLLPEPMVHKQLKEWPLDLTDDHNLRRLAKKFGVSETLAAKRLADLGLI